MQSSKESETTLSELNQKIKKQEQAIDELMKRALSQDTSSKSKEKKASWSLGLSDSESDNEDKNEDDNRDKACNMMINGGDDQDSENPEIEALLEDIEKGIEFGSEVLPHVAEGFKNTVLRPLKKESKEKLKMSLKIPKNCKEFIPPKINSEIWRLLPSNARLNDIKNQQLQHGLSVALSSLSQIASTVIARKADVPQETTSQVVRLAMDAANILGDQIQAINSSRRQDVKKYLNPEYAGICNAEIPHSEWLFGNELNETLKSSKATSTLIRQTQNRSLHRYQPYTSTSRSRGSFSGSLNGNRPFRHPLNRGNGQFRQNHPRQFPSQTQQYNQQKFRKF